MKTIEKPKFDGTPFIGNKSNIERATVIKTRYGLALKVESKVLTTLDNGVEIRASKLMGFGEDEENGLYIIKESKLDKFLESKGVNSESIPEDITEGTTVIELLDKPVTVQMDSKTNFLDLI